MDAVEFHGESAKQIAAFPYMINPFHWAGVAETSTAYISMNVNSLRPEVDPGNRAQSYYKPENTPVTQAARNTDLGRAYIEWARFPLVEAEHITTPDPAELVHFTDVRFLYPDERRRPLQAYVLLDSHLHAESQGFESGK
jgi:inner membrane protein